MSTILLSKKSYDMTRRMRFALAASVVAALALSLMPTRVLAADGDLDTSFGTNGKVVTDFFGGIDQITSMALQPDGKIVVAGYASSGATDGDFALARYDAAGNPDPTFGTNGKVTTAFSSGFDEANAIALQPDGKIIVAGVDTQGGGTFFNFALARYNSNGSLDTTFGTNGKVTTDFASGFDVASAILLQSDGKIVVAGAASQGSGGFNDFALARYNSDGSLDASFGTNGKVITDFTVGSEQTNDFAFALARQTDGKIIAAGFTVNPTGGTATDFALARYDGNGNLDAGFGIGGRVVTDFSSGFDFVFSIALQADGKIVAAGSTREPGAGSFANFGLARYDGGGNLDTSFGVNGKVVTDFSGNDDRINSIALQSDGKIIAAGFASDGTGYNDFALARYDGGGSLDATFGTNGKVRTAFSVLYDQANAMALQSDGKIIAAGAVNPSGNTYDFALARYEASASEGTPSASELLNALKATVASYNLPKGIQNSLTVKLDAALSALASGDTARACGSIAAFKNEAKAQSGKKLTASQAAQLTRDANQIRSALGCQ